MEWLGAKGGWGRVAPPTFLSGVPRGERARGGRRGLRQPATAHSLSSDMLPISGIADKRVLHGLNSLVVPQREFGEVATEGPMREMAPQCALVIVGCGGWR